MATINTILYTLVFGKRVGTDQFGNKYYTHKKRRWVVYKGISEASKVPADWHRWLHKTTDNIPDTNAKTYDWEKPHLPNLSGTDMAYVPEGHVKSGTKRKTAVTGQYEAWKPE